MSIVPDERQLPMDYTVRVDRPSEQVIPELVNALERRDLRVMITFDLQLARAHQVDCHCPHHGTEECTCQYAVLLVYGQKQGSGVYRTVTVHGRDGEVWLSLLQSPTLPAEVRSAHEALGKELLDILLGLVGIVHPQVAETDEVGCAPESGA